MDSINSIADAIEHIRTIVADDFDSHKIWFRGVNDKRYNLRPSVFRPKQTKAEEEIIDRLRAIRPDEVDQPLPLDTLAILQHYGAPTRLLDWSTNLLVSLFFASQKPDIDGKLFVLEPLKLNEANRCEHFSSRASIYDAYAPEAIVRACMAMSASVSEMTTRLVRYGFSLEMGAEVDNQLEKFTGSWAVVAPLRNARLIAQNGAFTIQGGKMSPEAIPANKAMWSDRDVSPEFIDEQNEKFNFLREYTIPGGDSKMRILSELKALGVNEASLFPELEYTARSIT